MAGQRYDPTLKTLVETSPGDWPVLLGQPAGPTEVIDADIATISGAADKVLRVRAAPPYLLHLEFQSGHDSSGLPRKLHVRSALLDSRHELPVHSAAIVLRPQADSPVLTGEWRRAFPGQPAYHQFRYQVVRVWQLPPGPLLRGGLGTLPLAPISAVAEAELPGIIREMEARLQERRLRRYAEEAWSASFILMGLRYPSELVRHLLQGVRSMKESTTYQWLQEVGALNEARKFLLKVGRPHLGEPDARVRKALDHITNVERLEELGERLLQAASWEELLGLPKSRRRSKA